MAFNIPLLLTGTGAGFLVGGPVGAVIGAAAGAALGKKPSVPSGHVLVDTPSGPVVVNPDPGVPPSVQAKADLVNQIVDRYPGVAPYLPADLPFIPGF